MWLGSASTFSRRVVEGEWSSPEVAGRLGDYELLEEIARGGMGVVYRARQVSLNRQVAIKVLIGGQFADETYIQRFQREAEATASLNHPNIVAIHEVGEHDGQLYFSMDLIEGDSLAETIRKEALSPRPAAQLIRTVAEAVAFAHGRGLFHRDLKPSNVLLDEQGLPHITDFGLVKRSGAEADLTQTGQILGSPNYMAPEQADPDLAPTSAASDVYALGAILYHLLAGGPPFHAETVAQTLRLVIEQQPVPPRLLNPGAPRDLETICLRCLEKVPRLRYASAQELADELGRFLQGEPIRARPIGVVTKLGRWMRRKPALASSLGIAALLFLVVCIGSPITILRIQRERELSEAARNKEASFRLRAVAGERHARQQLYTALVEQADASVRSEEIGQRLRALDAIRNAAVISNSVELRREALMALALPDLRLERELPTAESTMQVMDSELARVALCRGNGPVEIRAVSDWRLQATLAASTNLPAYVGWWSADRNYFAVKRDLLEGGRRADIEVWDVSKPKRIVVLHDVVSHAMSFHPFEHRLITAQVDGGTTIWDLEKGEPIARLELAGEPDNLEFAPDGERFAAVKDSGEGSIVSVHSTATGAIRASHSFADPVSCVAWHPLGRWVAIADHAGMVHLLDSQTGEVRALGSHKAQAATVTFSPEGDYLLSGGWEGELICWDMRTMQRALTVGRKSWIAQFRSDGKECALVTPSGIQLYAFVRPNPRGFAEDLGPRLLHAAFSRDGHWIAAAADHYVGVWDLTGAGPGALDKEVEEGRPGFSADSKELFASGRPGTCSRWRLTPGTNNTTRPLLQTGALPTPDELVSLSVCSNAVALTGSKGSAIIRLEDAGKTDVRWSQTAEGLNGISADCQWLGIYKPFSPFLWVYHLPDLEPATVLTNRANIGDFVFSPAGNEVAVSSRSGVEFWSTNTWTRTRVLTNFIGILFSPSGPTCWLSSDFRTAGLYELTTLEPLLPLPTGTLPLALSSDGRRLAVSVNARCLQVWDLEDVKNQLSQLHLDWQATPAASTKPSDSGPAKIAAFSL